MNQDLQRIESALHGLTPPQALLAAGNATPAMGDQRAGNRVPQGLERSLSFTIHAHRRQQAATASNPVPRQTHPQPTVLPPTLPGTPRLPRVKTAGFTSHRNAANPGLALNLLKELQTRVEEWQQELHQVLRQIQDVYLEGPIIEGWLESYASQDGELPAFRHAEVDCLLNYVEKLTQEVVPTNPSPPLQPEVSHHEATQAAGAGYRLCGLNEDGQLWFCHCPPEQIPAVSLAIVRYQRLQVLLTRKDVLEKRLIQLSETLVGVHSQVHLTDLGV